MVRYAGIKNGKICFISNEAIHSDMQVIPVPEELSHVPSRDLILRCCVKNGALTCKCTKKPAKDLKLALVSNWKMKCGIATYAENLWPEVVKHVGDFKLFVEDNASPKTGPLAHMAHQPIPPDKVIACWKRGEYPKKLLQEIQAYDPDIVWIRHEFGLWPNARHWLSLMNQLSEYRVIVTMHSVFHHRDKTICEAAMPEIVTHLQGGYDTLVHEKKVPGKVSVIPHGCDPCISKERLWNFYKSEHTFCQFGFGFRYKGWENAIKATALLKDKFPDVFFTGLFSESPHNTGEHQMYYSELMSLVKELGVQEQVGIIRGFQSEEALDSYLRTNQVSLFPYVSHPSHEVYGASGAARTAMSKGLPVVTSSVNHFSDLPTLKADTPQEMAQVLEKLFTDPQARQDQVNRQIAYLAETTWEKVALRYISLFENGNG